MTSLLFHHRALRQTGTAIVDSSGRFTYGQLDEAASRIASALLTESPDLKEQRIAFLIRPGFHYVATLLGIWRAGGIAVPLGFKHPPPELEYVVTDARVSSMIVGQEFASRVPRRRSDSLPQLVVEEMQASETQGQIFPVVDATRRGLILYTSGSTGRPKGVVTTHANISAQIQSLVAAWEWQPSDQILHVLPLHHIHGIINALCCSLRVGASCEFQPFDAVPIWDRLAAGDLTLFMAVPTIYAKLVNAYQQGSPEQQSRWTAGAASMRLMVSGSAALPTTTLEHWERITGQRLLERYGMTEIGMALSNPYRGERRPGYVGRPLPDVEIRRTSETGGLVDEHSPGEIEVRGPNVFLEYWDRPEITADSFRDGWFRTGDIAVIDNGDYRILGRSSVDIIKTGGYKVSALEIEEVLRDHPAINDCAVVGIPDEEWGERVAVCITTGDPDFELVELRAWGKERLAPYKVPTMLRIVAELPRNVMGKVQKPRVREMFEA